jgi:HEPN domain-containing protein
MNKDLRDYILQWFERADHDIIAATTLLESSPLVLDIVSFHCQQAVEKYLKAYLAYKSIDFGRTHNLTLLQKQAVDVDTGYSIFDFGRLNEFAVQARYPDYPETPTITEAKEFLDIAERIKKLVRSKILID